METNIDDNYANISNQEFIMIKEYFDLFNTKNKLSNLINKNNISDKITAISNSFPKNEIYHSRYPHILSILTPQITDSQWWNSDNINKQYFLFLLLGIEDPFFTSLKTYYSNIIKNNCFGIPEDLISKSIITPKTFSSRTFLSFVDSLSNWYTKNENIIYYHYWLNTFYNLDWINKTSTTNRLTEINNFHRSLNLFSKKNALKLGSYLLKNIKVDTWKTTLKPKSFLKYVNSIVKMGLNTKDILFFDISKWIGGSILSYLIKAFGYKLDKDNESEELKGIINNINEWNTDLDTVIIKIRSLWKNEILFNVNKELNSRGVYKEKEGGCDFEKTIGILIRDIKEYYGDIEERIWNEYEILSEIKEDMKLIQIDNEWINIISE